jgi:hypothetical protein
MIVRKFETLAIAGTVVLVVAIAALVMIVSV